MEKTLCTLSTGVMATAAFTDYAEAPDTASSDDTPLVLNKVAHFVSYVSQYTAVELGHSEDEGVDLTLVNDTGAGRVMITFTSGDVQIGLVGSEASIYVYQEDSQGYAVNPVQLIQRTGNFLVGHQPEDSLKWESLKGEKVPGGCAGGMPQMVFKYILKKHGLDSGTDLEIDQSASFGLAAIAFIFDDADYTVEFELFAIIPESEGSGIAIASLGIEPGYVPYTACYTKKSYMEKNPKLTQKFTNAIQRGMDYVNSHSAEGVAKTIASQFRETLVDEIATIVGCYKDQDTWKDDIIFERGNSRLLENILEEAGELSERAPHEKPMVTQSPEATAK